MTGWLIIERIDEEEWPKLQDKHCHACGCELKNKEAACLRIFLDEFPNVEFLCCNCAEPKIKEDAEALLVAQELIRRLKGEVVEEDEKVQPEAEEEKELAEPTAPDEGEVKEAKPEPEIVSSLEAEKEVSPTPEEAAEEMVEAAEETKEEEVVEGEEEVEGTEEAPEETESEEEEGAEPDHDDLELEEPSEEEAEEEAEEEEAEEAEE